MTLLANVVGHGRQEYLSSVRPRKCAEYIRNIKRPDVSGILKPDPQKAVTVVEWYLVVPAPANALQHFF